MKKIVVYIPNDHKEKVKEAMFKAGAGQIGNYKRCSFEVEGIGQFLPCQNSNPFLGEKDKLERVKEFRVEMICKDELLSKVVEELRNSHPYEEPAFDIISLENNIV